MKIHIHMMIKNIVMIITAIHTHILKNNQNQNKNNNQNNNKIKDLLKATVNLHQKLYKIRRNNQ